MISSFYTHVSVADETLEPTTSSTDIASSDIVFIKPETIEYVAEIPQGKFEQVDLQCSTMVFSAYNIAAEYIIKLSDLVYLSILEIYNCIKFCMDISPPSRVKNIDNRHVYVSCLWSRTTGFAMKSYRIVSDN